MGAPDNTGRPAQVPRVSVIIPVRNDPDGVRQALACLARQTLPRDRYEVIVGDDGSDSNLAPPVPETEPGVRLTSGPPMTSYAARNRAARLARGDVLAFCDADCLPEPEWLERGLAAFDDADIVAGEVVFRPPERPTVWTLLTIDLFLDQKQNVRLSRGVTANLLARRKDFEALRGFDQSLPSGGDYDFVNRMVEKGARLRYEPRAAVGHPTMDQARPFLNKIFRTNYWSGVRRARNGDRMDLAGILALVPVLGVMLARRQAFRPAFGLQQDRLRSSGVRSTPSKRLLAVASLYFVVYFVAGSGRVLGWLKGMKMARSGPGPVYMDGPDGEGRDEKGSKGGHSWS